jgi:hypothetical protein
MTEGDKGQPKMIKDCERPKNTAKDNQILRKSTKEPDRPRVTIKYSKVEKNDQRRNILQKPRKTTIDREKRQKTA